MEKKSSAAPGPFYLQGQVKGLQMQMTQSLHHANRGPVHQRQPFVHHLPSIQKLQLKKPCPDDQSKLKLIDYNPTIRSHQLGHNVPMVQQAAIVQGTQIDQHRHTNQSPHLGQQPAMVQQQQLAQQNSDFQSMHLFQKQLDIHWQENRRQLLLARNLSTDSKGNDALFKFLRVSAQFATRMNLAPKRPDPGFTIMELSEQHASYSKYFEEFGFALPAPDSYATGIMVFEEASSRRGKVFFQKLAGQNGLKVFSWKRLTICGLLRSMLNYVPVFFQVFLTPINSKNVTETQCKILHERTNNVLAREGPLLLHSLSTKVIRIPQQVFMEDLFHCWGTFTTCIDRVDGKLEVRDIKDPDGFPTFDVHADRIPNDFCCPHGPGKRNCCVINRSNLIEEYLKDVEEIAADCNSTVTQIIKKFTPYLNMSVKDDIGTKKNKEKSGEDR